MTAQEAMGSCILVVEDEAAVAADLESSLRDLGFRVLSSSTAEQAILLAERERPDLVLTDIQLNGKAAGLEVADTVRRSWDIPVVFLTAYPSEEWMARARATGAYGFLSKPFRVEELKATIMIALEQHRWGRQLFAEHNWLTTLLAALNDGVIATDAAGRVRYINPAAEQLLGWPGGEALGRPIEDVYQLSHLDGTPTVECQLRRALLTGKPIPKERFLARTRTGAGSLTVEDAAAPMVEHGRILGAMTVFVDVSARVRAEAEQREEHGRLERRARIASQALGETQEELRALSSRLITAQEDERRRVARELHDDLGQRAALMGWRVAELNRLLDGGLAAEARLAVAALDGELRDLSAELRRVSHRLHPAAIADLGLPTALEDLIEQLRAQGLEVSLVARELPLELPVELATMLYRIAQEALRNAVQHAARAPVLVTLDLREGELMLKVEDCGPGFQLEAVRHRGGLGLLSMGERARMLGGALELTSTPEVGTTVVVRVPLAERTASGV